MAGEYDIKTNITLGGDKEYRAGLKAINAELKLAKSNMTAATSAFDANDKSVAALTAKSKGLQGVYDAQQKKVELLRQKLEQLKTTEGTSAEEMDRMQLSLNSATTAMNRTALQMQSVNDAIAEAEAAEAAAAQSAEDMAGSMEAAGEGAESLQSNLANVDGSNLDDADGAAQALGESLQKAAKVTFTAVVTSLAAVTAAAAAASAELMKISGDAGEYADELNTMSKQTGIAVDTLQRWTYASAFIDTSVDTMTGAMRKMVMNMGNAADGSDSAMEKFSALGLSIYDSAGNLKDSEQLFLEAIDALGGIENEAERDAKAMDLFGKSAQELNPLILAGTDTLRELGDQAAATGYVMSDSAIQGMQDYQDSLDSMKLAGTALKNSIASEVIPAFQPLIDTATDAMQRVTVAMQNGASAESIAAIINDIQKEFDRAIDNFADIFGNIAGVIVDMIPSVTSALSKMLSKAVQNISKQLPTMVKGLTASLPSLFKDLGGALPQVVESVLESVGTIMGDVIASIPEWAPELGKALLNTCEAAVKGVGSAISSIIDGVLTLSGFDITTHMDADDVMAKWLSGADMSTVQPYDITLDPTATVNPVTNIETIKAIGQQAVTDIVDAYTDGIYGNDFDANGEFHASVEEAVGLAIADINNWRDQSLTALQGQYEAGQITLDEYTESSAEINDTADAMIADVETARDDMIAWGDSYAGAATSVVQAHVGELEDAWDRVEAVETKIDELTGELTAVSVNRFAQYGQALGSGYTLDTGVTIATLQSNTDQLTAALDANNTARQTALDEASATYGDDLEGLAAAQAQINADFAAEEDRIKSEFRNNAAYMFAGIGESLGPEAMQAMERAIDLGPAAGHIKSVLSEWGDVTKGIISDEYRDEFGSLTGDGLAEWLMDSSMTEDDYRRVAEKMGIIPADGQTWGEAISAYVTKNGLTDDLHTAMNAIMDESARYAQDWTSIVPPDLEEIIMSSVNKSWAGGIRGLTFNDDGTLQSATTEGIYKLLTGVFGNISGNTIEGLDVTTKVPVHAETTEGEVEGDPNATAAAEAQAQADAGEPQEVTTETVVNTEVVTGDDTALEDDVNEKAQTLLNDANMSVDVKAAVSLQVSVSDSNGAEVGLAAGREIARAISDGIQEQDQSAGVSAAVSNIISGIQSGSSEVANMGKKLGGYFASGFAKGITNNADKITSAAKKAAKAAYDAAADELGIASPSKVMAEVGMWYDMGMVKGIEDNSKAVVNAAAQLADMSVSPVQVPTTVTVQQSAAPAAETVSTVNNYEFSYAGPYTRNNATAFSSAIAKVMNSGSIARGK